VTEDRDRNSVTRDGDERRPCTSYSRWSPAVNVLLIVGLFAAVKLKLVLAAVVLAGFTGYAMWRAWA
jgi:hypothetical protein